MKIAFRGFRGFGEGTELLELNEITLLTGKNSSGKTTFIKLLQLLSEALKGINSLKEFANIEINIANDIIGGKENLESLQNVAQPKWIFSIPFEFYNAYHEVHVNFNIENYTLTVKSLEIYDEYCLSINKPFFVIEKDLVTVNTKYLFGLYNKYATLYNFIESILPIFNKDKKKTKEEVIKMIDEFRIKNNYSDEEFKTIATNHIPYNDQAGYLFTSPGEEYEHPFKCDESYFGNFVYNRLSLIEISSPEITKTEAIEIVSSSEYFDLVEAYIAERLIYEPGFDFYDLLSTIYNNELERFYLGSERFHYGEPSASVKRFIDGGYVNFVELNQNSIHEYNDGEHQISFPDWEEFYPNVFIEKFIIALKIASISSHIFQHFIIRFFKTLVDFKFQSNIRTIPERSFNIFNSGNIFSVFIKNWKILTNEDRLSKMNFLTHYITKFEIADSLEIKIEGNIGFLRLIKKGFPISIIDEGSGISNLLSCLLFTSQFLKVNDKAFDIKDERQYLVLEEPEANLHPCLQSLLADLIIDVVSNYKVSFIIETHSEYLIRKLQFLIAKGEIQPKAVSLNYFTLSFNNEAPIILNQRIHISNAGSLENEFGPGFFDEADNIAIELFKLQKNQSN